MLWPTKDMVGQKLDLTWTVEDYEHLPVDGNRYEILDGELAMTPAPCTDHQRISRRLQFILYQAIEVTGRGEVFNAPFDVELDRKTIVQPDLAVVLRASCDRLTQRRLIGPPDLVVEILSMYTAPHDLRTKAGLYARFGVPWYWIVDPESCEISEYGLEAGVFRLYGVFEKQDTFSPRGLPGLSFPLTRVFDPPHPG